MKKSYLRLIIIIAFFLTAHNIFCQMSTSRNIDIQKYTDIDSVFVEISYSLKVLANPSKPNNIVEDICILQIGKNISKSYSETLFRHDSLIIELRKNKPSTLPFLQKAVPPIEVYKNYPNKGFCTVTYRTWGPPTGPILKYKKEMPKFDWKIHPETKNILGYLCSRATTTFSGRNYEAWFASSLPIFDGPWKFGGLPGLIMQIQDSENHYVFECVSIKKKGDNTIKFWNTEYKECTYSQYMATLKRMYKFPSQWLSSLGAKLRVADGSDASKLSYPFNELELE